MDALRRYEGAITDQDIRAFLTRTIRTARGIPKRPSGGIYFVPVQYASIVLAAQKSLADMGTKARIYTERVVNGVQERQNVWGSVQEDVDDQINKLLDEVSKITKRASAVRTKQAKLGEIKELAKMYQDMLGEEARYEDLTAKFAAAERAISAKMVEVQEQVNAAPESCDGASVETEVLQLAVA
jgi:hypothetical protein